MVTIGMPVHGPVDARTMMSLVASVAAMGEGGVAWTTDIHMQDADVSRARSAIAARFLRGTSDRLVFIDADMVWTPDDLRALLESDGAVVGASYSTKSANPRRVGALHAAGEVRGDLVEADALGCGFMAITRTCLERMVGAYQALAYVAGDDAGADSGRVVHNLFGAAIVDGRYLADDWAFCHRWRAIGGRLWMHTGIKPGHVGTHVYTIMENA